MFHKQSQKICLPRCDFWPRCQSLTLETLKWAVAWLVLAIRAVGFLLFATWANDCFFREFRTTATCKNFSLFPYPQLLVSFWLLATSSTSVSLLLYVKTLAKFPGFKIIVSHLVKQLYFCKIFVNVVLVVIYDFLTLTSEPQFWRSLEYFSFLVEHVTGVFLMFTLNLTPKFLQKTDKQYITKTILYKLTLAVYSLEGYGMFVLGTIIALYKVVTVSSCNQLKYAKVQNSTTAYVSFTSLRHSLGSKKVDECHDAITVVMLLLLMISNAWRFTVGNFFLAKLFSEDCDHLSGRHQMINSLLPNEENVEV